MNAIPSPTRPEVADRQVLARRVRGHREVLILALLTGLAAPLLRVYPPDRVGWRWSADLLLPPLCTVRQWFGINCPGCGMTRSFVYLAQGDLVASWRMHRLGVLFAFLIVLQIPYRLLAIRSPRRPMLPDVVTRWLGRILILLLLVNWLVNLFLLR
jgi:hypothetical protein